MNVNINFTRIDFESALKELSASEDFFTDFRNSANGCTTIAGIVALYCLHEPIGASDPSIVHVHLPTLLSHPRLRLELCDKLFANSEPTYDHLETIVKLIVQIAFHRLQMSQVRKAEQVATSVC